MDYKYRKLELDIEILETCHRHNFLPKFLQIKVGNSESKKSENNTLCQLQLLNEEISIKRNKLETDKLELEQIYKPINPQVSFLDQGHIHSVITTGNQNSIDQAKRTQYKNIELL